MTSCSTRFFVKLWKQNHTEIGPVLEVKTFCHLDKHGIDNQIHCTSGDKTNVWVVMCRGANRYVDELRYKDPEPSPKNLEEVDYGGMQEIHAEQLTIQSGPQCSLSDDHLPTPERKGVQPRIRFGTSRLKMCWKIGTSKKPP